MLRLLRVPWPGRETPPLEQPSLAPPRVVLDLPTRYGMAHTPAVTPGQAVRRGECVATADDVLTHAPLDGRVTDVSPTRIVMDTRGSAAGTQPPEARGPEPATTRVDADYLRRIGLLGMGGSLFPAARKLAACREVHTLVVNGVECEPGITIDRTLLTSQPDLIVAGARALAEAVGAKRIVLALPRESALVLEMRRRTPFSVVTLPRSYPAGAEKLIVRRLARRPLAPGELPVHAGYLVHNAASLRAVGQALAHGWPVIERPISLARPDAGAFRNVVVPVGVEFGVLLEQLGIAFDPATDIAVAGGLMMGAEVTLQDAVTKGTTSLVVLPRGAVGGRERPCIRCGACNDACPLGLHPIGMVDRLRAGKADDPALRVQLETCFYCGACSGVCPANIPLAKRLRDGMAWIRNRNR